VLAGLLLLAAGRRVPVDPEAPTPETHVRCPECRELVRADAVKCRHCGATLVPQVAALPTADERAAENAQRGAERALKWVSAGLALLVGLLALAYGW
jgi:hypothetical protein